MTEIGAVLADKYKVLAKLGEGGMGSVFRAENLLTGKQVALKCLHSHVTASKEASERLLREARASASLSHPNVVDVYDVVRDGETLFLVMELLRGETLRAYLSRNPQPKISEFIAMILPALSGVATAHERGVIHRDLKPDNIFLAQVPGGQKNTIKVLDFGIAKLAVARGPTLTQTGMALGTPLYMSLEQLRGDKDVDQRADVYAFGVMLYEAVTGRLPYEAETLPELAIKVATTDPAPVKSLRSDVPTALARIIDWAVARERSQRLPNIRTFEQELEVFSRDHSFRDQMTHRDAAVPRLAPESGEPAAPSAPPTAAAHQAKPDRAGRPQPVRVSDPDTLRARELGPTAHPRRVRPRWLFGAAAAAGTLIAGGWLAQREPETSLAPVTAEPNLEAESAQAPVPTPPIEVQHAVAPSPLTAPGATLDTDPPAAEPSEANRKPSAAAAAMPAVPERKDALAPSPAPKPALQAARTEEPSTPNGLASQPGAGKLSGSRAVSAKPAAITGQPALVKPQQLAAEPAATPAPTKKKSSLDLVGF